MAPGAIPSGPLSRLESGFRRCPAHLSALVPRKGVGAGGTARQSIVCHLTSRQEARTKIRGYQGKDCQASLGWVVPRGFCQSAG